MHSFISKLYYIINPFRLYHFKIDTTKFSDVLARWRFCRRQTNLRIFIRAVTTVIYIITYLRGEDTKESLIATMERWITWNLHCKNEDKFNLVNSKIFTNTWIKLDSPMIYLDIVYLYGVESKFLKHDSKAYLQQTPGVSSEPSPQSSSPSHRKLKIIHSTYCTWLEWPEWLWRLEGPNHQKLKLHLGCPTDCGL